MLHIKVKNGYKWTQTNVFLICIKKACLFVSVYVHCPCMCFDIIKLGSLSWINGKVYTVHTNIYLQTKY